MRHVLKTRYPTPEEDAYDIAFTTTGMKKVLQAMKHFDAEPLDEGFRAAVTPTTSATSASHLPAMCIKCTEVRCRQVGQGCY